MIDRAQTSDVGATTAASQRFVAPAQAALSARFRSWRRPYDVQPAWSPDGTRIAFTRHRAGHDRALLCIAEADGSSVRIMTALWDNDYEPAWSPDGIKIAFTSTPWHPGEGEGEVHVMDAYTSARSRLTFMDADTSCPAWSPDGGWIAFAKDDPPGMGIYVTSADGSEVHQLTSEMDVEPAWSPNGEKIVFARRGSRVSQLYVMDRSGGEQRRLTSSRKSDTEPAWSPDGGEIAFTRGHSIYVMEIDAGAERLLTRGGAHASWSPDATKIVFTWSGELFVIDADGGGRRPLLTRYERGKRRQPCRVPHGREVETALA